MEIKVRVRGGGGSVGSLVFSYNWFFFGLLGVIANHLLFSRRYSSLLSQLCQYLRLHQYVFVESSKCIDIFRFWVVDNIMDGTDGTCQGKQSDGSCLSLFLPDCVDRNVYCSTPTTPANSTTSIITQPSPGRLEACSITWLSKILTISPSDFFTTFEEYLIFMMLRLCSWQKLTSLKPTWYHKITGTLCMFSCLLLCLSDRLSAFLYASVSQTFSSLGP